MAINRAYTDKLGRSWRIDPMIPPDTLCEQADCYRLAEMQMTLAEHNVYVCSLHPDLVTAAWEANEPVPPAG